MAANEISPDDFFGASSTTKGAPAPAPTTRKYAGAPVVSSVPNTLADWWNTSTQYGKKALSDLGQDVSKGQEAVPSTVNVPTGWKTSTPVKLPGAVRAAASLGKTGLDALSYMTAPVTAAFDVASTPVEQVTKGAVPRQTAGALLSLFAPAVGELNAARETGALAKAAGVTQTAYEQNQAALAAGRQAVAADVATKAAQAKRLAQLQKPTGVIDSAVGPIVASVSPKAAKAQAQRRFIQSASDVPAATAALTEQAAPLVEGSAPTTAEVTQDPGISALAGQVAVAKPAPFLQREGERQAARTTAVRTIQDGADPVDIATTIRGHLNDLSAEHDAAIEDARQKAQDAAQDIGGHQSPADYGDMLRAGMHEGEQTTRKNERALWGTINSEVPIDASHTAAQASAIPAKMMRATSAPMKADEAGIFQAAADLGPNTPFADLTALRSRITARMGELVNKQDPEYARLARLRGAIEDNLANHMTGQVTSDSAAVAAGDLNSEDALSTKLNRWVEAWQNPDKVAEENINKDVADWRSRTAPPVEKSADQLAEERAQQVAQQAADAEKAQQDADLEALQQEARVQLGAATRASKERFQTYGQGPVGSILASQGTADNFKMPSGQVPSKFFVPGDGGFDAMQAAVRADPNSLPVLADYAAYTLRKAAVAADGTMDPGKFAQWQKTYGEALRALPPEYQQKFADAATAGQTVADAAVARTNALKEVQTKAVKQVMDLTQGQDVTSTIGGLLNGRTAVADMGDLAARAASEPTGVATAGLRQAVVDHLMNKFVDNAGNIKADQFQTFLRNKRDALAKVLSPDELDRLDAVAADLQSGSTAAKQAAQLKGGQEKMGRWTFVESLARQAPFLAARAGVGAGVGAMLEVGSGHGTASLVGHAAVGAIAAQLFTAMRMHGISSINDALAEIVLNPELAKAALTEIPTKPVTSAEGLRQSAGSVLNAMGKVGGVSAAAPRPSNKEVSPEEFFGS